MEKEDGEFRKMRLTVNEWCRVMRWRARKSQRVVAAEMGMTRNWINRIECGLEKADSLLWYWEH